MNTSKAINVDDKSLTMDGEQIKVLIITVSTICVLVYFIYYITKNILLALKEYYDQVRKTDGSQITRENDDNSYLQNIHDDRNFQHVMQDKIKNTNKVIDDLTASSRKYKNELNIDDRVYGKLNNKTFSRGIDDNYNYENKFSFIDFFNDLFRRR